MLKPKNINGSSCVRFQQVGMRSESSVVGAGRSPQSSESSDEPSPFVDIELHQAFVSHFQQEGLASFLIHDIGAFHDLVDFERLLAERAEDIFSIIQHDLVKVISGYARVWPTGSPTRQFKIFETFMKPQPTETDLFSRMPEEVFADVERKLAEA